LLQILLAVFGPELGGSIMAWLGGPKLVVGEPSIENIPALLPNLEIKPHFSGIPSGGTISYDHLYSPSRQSTIIPSGHYLNRHYIHVPIHNQQKSRLPISTARDVYAKLRFFHLDGTQLGRGAIFDGRWSTSDQPSGHQNAEKLRFKDILAGDSQALDIAAQASRGGVWYAWNNNNYPDYKYLPNALAEEGFGFLLELSGKNCAVAPVCYRFVSGKSQFERVRQVKQTRNPA